MPRNASAWSSSSRPWQRIDLPEARALLDVADKLVDKSVWIVGGDGWAYDIGFGGLDHVLASGRNVNVLVLDTEVYSNTGGQMSKSTPRGAVAKFAAGGKARSQEGSCAHRHASYPAYVARIAMGFSDTQTLKAFNEAEAFDGPSIIVAYSHCIAHGYDLVHGLEQQKLAVQSGHWPLFRYNPDAAPGHANFVLDSRAPSIPLEHYIYNETRYTMLRQSNPEAAKILLDEAQKDARRPLEGLRGVGADFRCRRRRSSHGCTRRKRSSIMIDLSTKYLGLKLRNPLVVAASPLCKEIANLRHMEDAGAAAVVLHSLFEEQINVESNELDRFLWDGSDVSAESTSIFPDLDNYNIGPDGYLEHIRLAKQAVSIPVIASLNGVSRGGWVSYARDVQQAGADAIELNVYFIPADPALQLRTRWKNSISTWLRRSATPSPFRSRSRSVPSSAPSPTWRSAWRPPEPTPSFSSTASTSRTSISTRLRSSPALTLSNSSELLLRLHWAAILYGHLHADIAITGGVHTAEDVVKSMMAGAKVTHARLGSLAERHRLPAPAAQSARSLAGKARVRKRQADAGQHEPEERPQPQSLPARQLHEGALQLRLALGPGQLSKQPKERPRAAPLNFAPHGCSPACDPWPANLLFSAPMHP